MNSRTLRVFASVCALALLNGCSTSQQQTQQLQPLVRPAAQPRSLTILHTNDMHAGFLPHDANWVKKTPKPLVGGFKELQFAIDSIRGTRENVLLLDAGDVMTGHPISDLVYNGAEGGALYEMMNTLGYDAACLGNHEFDISQENVRGLVKIARFPLLSANLVNSQNRFPVNNKDYVILERGGVKIGVFGLMLQGFAGVVNPLNIQGIKILSPEETAQNIIDAIDEKTDLLIALSHMGVDEDSALAATVRGLDIIVGGHSHTRLTKPRVVNDVVIVQAGSNVENLGKLDITIADDKVAAYNGRLIQLWANSNRPQTQLGSLIDSLQRVIDKNYDEVIAELKDDWQRSKAESNIGNFVADAQREAAQAQVAFMNSSGIRANVSAGPLTKRELFEVLPFRNILVTFQLSGRQLKDAILFGIRTNDQLQISGVTYSWEKKSDGAVELAQITVGGKPVDEKKTYICAASDFLVGQARKYLGFEVSSPSYSKMTVFQALEQAARKAQVIDTKIEGRMVELQ